MDSSSRKIEGYLYVINPHRITIRGFRKRYFVLDGCEAICYKSKPADDSDKLSLRHGLIRPFTKVEDHGLETIHGQLLHSFTLSDPENKLKLAAKTAEEAAKWMSAFREAAEQNVVSGSFEQRPSLGTATKANTFKDWTQQWTSKQASPDVISDSPWKIVGCLNGLRLYRESSKAKGRFRTKFSDDHPAVMAVGVIKASCEYIFNAVTTLGPLRAEWDFCYLGGNVVERIDGHTDIVHEQLRRKWLPGHMRQRDLLIHRYWRRENDGTYVILYRSVTHKGCPSRTSVVRANLKSGGYVISPMTSEGTYPARSLVRHMLEIDWKTWKSHFKPSRVQKITIRMLETVAALRELCKAEASSIRQGLEKKESCTVTEESAIHKEPTFKSAKSDLGTTRESFLQNELDDADEFYDAPDEDGNEFLDESESASEAEGPEEHDNVHKQPKLGVTLASVSFVRRLAQKKEAGKEAGALDSEGTLPRSIFNSSCCWDVAEPGTFLIRGKNYLRDQNKVKAKDTLMQLVAVDWYRSTERMDHVADRENTFMQKPKVRRLNRCFFFIVNLQVPGTTTYSLVLYYMLKDMLRSVPLLEKFVNGSDRFRSSRFKLIPHIAEGSWIVKQSVGKTACLVGEALNINYFHGKHHLELDVDVGSSSVAKGVVSLVFGYMKKLVVEMAFLVQANTDEELPEMLLGTCRISSLDESKAVQLTPRA